MYNEELKQQFIVSYSTSISDRNTAYTTFRISEPYEDEWGADICTRTVEELQPFFKNELAGLRNQTIKIHPEVLESYAKWCIKNNVPGACGGLLEINAARGSILRVKMVANPQHLQRYLDSHFAKESEETISCVYRCFFWLAFSGILEEEADRVKNTDIDFTHMIIRFDGHDYPLYREGVEAFDKCVTLTRFQYPNAHYRPQTVRYRDRAIGDMLLRGYGNTTSAKSIQQSISREYNKESRQSHVTYINTWYSGIFYRAYEDERIGIPPDFTWMSILVQQKRPGKKPLDDVERQRRIKYNANRYMTDYLAWKEAFSA